MTIYLIISIMMALYTLQVFPSTKERIENPEVHAIFTILIIVFFWLIPFLYLMDICGKVKDWYDKD